MECLLSKMALPNKIAKGVKIRNSLGGHFEEMKMLRRGLWALTVLTHKEEFIQADIDEATLIKAQLLELNNQIEEME